MSRNMTIPGSITPLEEEMALMGLNAEAMVARTQIAGGVRPLSEAKKSEGEHEPDPEKKAEMGGVYSDMDDDELEMEYMARKGVRRLENRISKLEGRLSEMADDDEKKESSKKLERRLKEVKKRLAAMKDMDKKDMEKEMESLSRRVRKMEADMADEPADDEGEEESKKESFDPIRERQRLRGLHAGSIRTESSDKIMESIRSIRSQHDESTNEVAECFGHIADLSDILAERLENEFQDVEYANSLMDLCNEADRCKAEVMEGTANEAQAETVLYKMLKALKEAISDYDNLVEEYSKMGNDNRGRKSRRARRDG